MVEKRFGIKPAIDTNTVGSPTTTGQARGPNDTGSPLAQDKATEQYGYGPGNEAPSGGSRSEGTGKDSGSY